MSVVVAGEVEGGENSITHCAHSTAITITITSAELPVCMYEWLMALKQCCHTASLDPPVREGGVTPEGRREGRGGEGGEERRGEGRVDGWMGRALHSPPLGLGTERVARGRVDWRETARVSEERLLEGLQVHR